jgi:hypothetical protein
MPSQKTPGHLLKPSKEAFGSDPFGYCALAWGKWAMALTAAGFPVDPSVPPTSEDLKSPPLWLSHAHALSEAATVILRNEPTFESMPELMRGICDSQYRAVGLMLVGYSLEICLKAMLIIREGVKAYTTNENKYKTHRLVELSTFIPNLTTSDKAILEALTHFVYWAGRYPDPGFGKASDLESIFTLSEKHKVSAKELFELVSKVMRHADTVTGIPS